MKEIWKDIPFYEGRYQVSNLGRVKSLDYIVVEKTGKSYFRKGRLLTNKLPKGACYYQIILSDGKVSKLRRIHRLVALAFIPNPNNLPDVNHIDRNKLNNIPENLEWCTKSKNMLHATAAENGNKGERVHNSILKDSDIPVIRELLKTKSQTDIAKKYNIGRVAITNLASGKTWKHIK